MSPLGPQPRWELSGHVAVSLGRVELLLEEVSGDSSGTFRPVVDVGEVEAGVRGRVALIAPTFGQRADVVGVVADAVEELGDHALRVRIVAGDRQHAALRAPRRPSLAAQEL